MDVQAMAYINEITSLWRSPLDEIALAQAHALSDRQPYCTTIGYDEKFDPMTIYNYGYYIQNYPPTPTTALTQMLLIMGALNPYGAIGGLAFIPQENFPLSFSSGGFVVPDQTVFVGSGGGGPASPTGGTPFYHFTVTPGSSAMTLLQCNNTSHTSGGVYFRSLAFQWGTPGFAGDLCISAGMWNVRAIRCVFTDCPMVFKASGLSCALEQCTINYTVLSSVGPNNTTAVTLLGEQCAALGPGVFSQTSQAPGSNGATGCTCISIEGAEHSVIATMQIYEWTIGVDFSQTGGAGSTLHSNITNCEIECWQHALRIKGPGTGISVAGIKVTSCTLAKTSDSSDSHAVVSIDANGDDLHDITLLDCTVVNMAPASGLTSQYGLAIASGYDIKVLGGTYSNNSPTPTQGAGIAITGAATDVQIIGVNLQPSYAGAPNTNSQQYALLISGGPTSVLVSGCDMNGYGSPSPVYVTGTAPTGLLITNCPGYNDRNTSLTAVSGTLTTGASAATAVAPYFGPSVLSYSNSTPVTLNVFGQSITASQGIVFLPNPYDTFYFTSAPISLTLVWTGK